MALLSLMNDLTPKCSFASTVIESVAGLKASRMAFWALAGVTAAISNAAAIDKRRSISQFFLTFRCVMSMMNTKMLLIARASKSALKSVMSIDL